MVIHHLIHAYMGVKVFPDSVTQEFQHSINISTKTVGWEIHGISFDVQVAPIGVMCG